MQFEATFVVLAFSGLIDTGYLVYKHAMKARQPLVCPLRMDCAKVTEGEFSKTFGIRNDYLGILYYLSALIGAFLGMKFPEMKKVIYTLLLLMTGGGLLFSGYLVYLQAKVIKEYCFYCLVSAGITSLLFINAINLFLNK